MRLTRTSGRQFHRDTHLALMPPIDRYCAAASRNLVWSPGFSRQDVFGVPASAVTMQSERGLQPASTRKTGAVPISFELKHTHWTVKKRRFAKMRAQREVWTLKRAEARAPTAQTGLQPVTRFDRSSPKSFRGSTTSFSPPSSRKPLASPDRGRGCLQPLF